MATIKKKHIAANQFGGFTPYGNMTTLRARLETIANGGPVNADSVAALAIGDVVVLNVLPEGFVPLDAQLIVSTGMSASVTGSLGFQYVDGVDSSDVPQDPAYFGTGLNLATAARVRNTAAKALVKLPKPAYLVLTLAGAANAKASMIDFIVDGERMGPK